MLTYYKWGVSVHGGYISFPGPELQALAGGRRSDRVVRKLPGLVLGAVILESSPELFWADPRSFGAVWVPNTAAELQTAYFVFYLFIKKNLCST